MALSHTTIVLIGATVVTAAVMIVVLVYFNGRQESRASRRREPLSFSGMFASLRSIFRENREAEPEDITDKFSFDETVSTSDDHLSTSRDVAGLSLAGLYRRIGTKQKVAGIGFIVASVTFLVLSLALQSVVLEIDSVVSFAVAAILFVRENREKVQSRVLNAVVLSLATTISGLSTRTGSKFLYSPEGKAVSDVTIIGSPDTGAHTGGAGEFRIVPPGMGLAKLFFREAGGKSLTPDSLTYLLPSVINEKFGLAEGVETVSNLGKVQVLLRKPAVYCTCNRDETRKSDVVGCTLSSFFATLYSFASQEKLSLERCETDEVGETWRVSMYLRERDG